MSQLILDEQLDVQIVLQPLRRWISVLTIQELRPNEQILDDRIPQILRALRHPTFVTIDQGFWNRRLCHPAYCILHFPLRDDQQSRLPGLLRALWRLPEFRVRKRRMGKVARIGLKEIQYWQFRAPELQTLSWPRPRRKRRN